MEKGNAIYGVSYGTQLVLRLLQLNSTKLDGVILDSLVPLQDDDDYDLSHRSIVTNNVGHSVLARYDKLESNDAVSLVSQLQNIIQQSKTNPGFAKNLPKQDLSILFGMMLDLPKSAKQNTRNYKGIIYRKLQPPKRRNYRDYRILQ